MKGLVAALVVALALSLGAVGFLLGRQSNPPTVLLATGTPSPALLPPVTQAPKPSLDQRLDALQARVDRDGQGKLSNPSSPPPMAPIVRTTDRVEYFRQVDAIVGGRSAVADPRPFATRLLDQGMAGDLDAVLARTEQTKDDLAALVAPPQCREHQALLLGQLTQAVGLLGQVKSALATGDTGELKALTEKADLVPEDAQRLRELDRALRPDSTESVRP